MLQWVTKNYPSTKHQFASSWRVSTRSARSTPLNTIPPRISTDPSNPLTSTYASPVLRMVGLHVAHDWGNLLGLGIVRAAVTRNIISCSPFTCIILDHSLFLNFSIHFQYTTSSCLHNIILRNFDLNYSNFIFSVDFMAPVIQSSLAFGINLLVWAGADP